MRAGRLDIDTPGIGLDRHRPGRAVGVDEVERVGGGDQPADFRDRIDQPGVGFNMDDRDHVERLPAQGFGHAVHIDRLQRAVHQALHLGAVAFGPGGDQFAPIAVLDAEHRHARPDPVAERQIDAGSDRAVHHQDAVPGAQDAAEDLAGLIVQRPRVTKSSRKLDQGRPVRRPPALSAADGVHRRHTRAFVHPSEMWNVDSGRPLRSKADPLSLEVDQSRASLDSEVLHAKYYCIRY